MGRWYALKRKMRNTVHDFMCRDAELHLKVGGETYAVTVRGPHFKHPTDVGGLVNSGDWAERSELAPRLILKIAELKAIDENWLSLVQGSNISFEPDEAYRVSRILPVDDQWLPVEVTPLDSDDLTMLFAEPEDDDA